MRRGCANCSFAEKRDGAPGCSLKPFNALTEQQREILAWWKSIGGSDHAWNGDGCPSFLAWRKAP